MSTPYVPPYFGSYEDLVHALLHDPFLGSGQSGPHRPRLTHADELNPQPLPPHSTEGPVPDPWRNAAVRYVATLVNMLELGKSLEDTNLGQQYTTNAEGAIQAFLDDFCGTPPRRIPWSWPGPPPWVNPLAAALVSAANSQSGALREGLMSVAGRVAAMAAPQKRSAGARG
jgi:hypothetical protein